MKILLLMFLLFSNITYSYINIYPSKFEKNITNGNSETFKLYNRSGKQIRYRIYLEEGDENDMSRWSEIYPNSITLNPLEEKEVRISIRPPKNAAKGKYKAKLIVKEVGIPRKEKSDKVNFFTLFRLNMTGYIGDNNEKTKKN
ncbi:COG1470 family protein [Cetobacterium sp.]|uniref:COG1470 family protein n=1 Tax=Cetobacterium sp. TaxID=2071632 RepID=UPI003F412483